MSSVESVYAATVMALLPEGITKRVALFVVAMVLGAACTSLLGDFEMAGALGQGGNAGQASGGTNGSGGPSSVGGSGGEAGSGGQAPLLPYNCVWKRAAHLELESLEGKQGESWDSAPLVVTMPSGGARMFILRDSPNGSVIEVRSVLDDTTATALFAADRLLDVKRLDAFEVAVLFSRADNNGMPMLFMRVYDDAAFDGSKYVEHQLVKESVFQDADPQYNSVRAMLAVRQEQGSWAVDVLLAYRTTSEKYVERFLRYDGKTPQTGTVITMPDLTLGSTETYVRGFERYDGKSYALLGQGVMRFYVIEDNVSGPLTAVELGADNDDIWMGAHATSAGLNLGMVLNVQMPPVELRLGQLQTAKLASYQVEDLTLAETWATTDDIPVGSAALKWLGNLYAFIGESQTTPAQMVYAFFDAFGNKRGTSQLPFTFKLPAAYERIDIDALDIAAQTPSFDTLGGLAHVAWREEQGDGVSTTFEVMYYDQLDCSPVDPQE